MAYMVKIVLNSGDFEDCIREGKIINWITENAIKVEKSTTFVKSECEIYGREAYIWEQNYDFDNKNDAMLFKLTF